MSIIQGTNNPLSVLLEYDYASEISASTDFHAILYKGSKTLKQWDKEDISVVDMTVYLPLNQNETMTFPKGMAVLEMKWLDGNGVTKFSDLTDVEIVYRRDRALLEVSS